MTEQIRILGCPVLPLDKGLEEDGVTYALVLVAGWTFKKPSLKGYSRCPFSFVDADEMLASAKMRLGKPAFGFAFMLSTSTIEQIRKDLESGAYRL